MVEKVPEGHPDLDVNVPAAMREEKTRMIYLWVGFECQIVDGRVLFGPQIVKESVAWVVKLYVEGFSGNRSERGNYHP
jgi:hypothetical protein